MCGIAGIWGAGAIEPMVEILAHRGPDDVGFFTDGDKPVKLGMRRLAVIDIEGGAQPMSNEDGSIHIVFNGMIFNYKELRSELSDRHDFKTRTDTETILHAYEEYGDSFPEKLNGMFSMALWDGRRLILARDRVGEKPLYWYKDDERFLFASEIKSILTQIDATPVFPESFFCLESPVKDETLFRGVQSLEPGCMLFFDGTRTTVRRYWRPESTEPAADKPDSWFVNRLRELIEDSVRLRMRSDVEVGLFLSGGLDSSLIACLARPQHVFSCSFPVGEGFNELHFAREVSDRIGSRMHVISPTSSDFRNKFSDILWHLDQPIATPSSIAEFLLAESASRHVKVVLGGQGADEAFGGYVRYLFLAIENELAALPQLAAYRPMARFFWNRSVFGNPAARYAQMLHRGSGEPPVGLIDLVESSFSRGGNIVDAMGLCDMDLTLPSLLTMNDRAAAAVGLENRCPFLDHRILEFAFSLPVRFKINNRTGKHILKLAAKGIVPDTIIDRTDKMGLVVPVSSWLAGELRPWADAEIGRLGGLGKKLTSGGAKRGEFDRSRYHALSTALWLKRFAPGWKPLIRPSS